MTDSINAEPYTAEVLADFLDEMASDVILHYKKTDKLRASAEYIRLAAERLEAKEEISDASIQQLRDEAALTIALDTYLKVLLDSEGGQLEYANCRAAMRAAIEAAKLTP